MFGLFQRGNKMPKPPEDLFERLIDGRISLPEAIAPPYSPRNGECFYLKAKVAEYSEGRSRGSRIVAGVRTQGVWVGESVGRSGATSDLSPVSHGILYLSNQRLIYIGRSQSHSLELADLAQVNVFRDGIQAVVEDGRNRLWRFVPPLSRDDIIWWSGLANALHCWAQNQLDEADSTKEKNREEANLPDENLSAASRLEGIVDAMSVLPGLTESGLISDDANRAVGKAIIELASLEAEKMHASGKISDFKLDHYRFLLSVYNGTYKGEL